MLQSIASYLWGAQEPAETEELVVEFEFVQESEETKTRTTDTDTDTDTDNEWIVVPTKDIESDFSEQEDDTAMVDETSEKNEENDENKDENAVAPPENIKATNGKRQVMLKKVLMKDWNEKVVMLRKNASSKKLKRINLVRIRVNGARKNKQMGRMEGKHIGMAGQRAK